MIECIRHTLPNGLRLNISPMKGAVTTSTWILVKGGSRVETKKDMGAFHLIEHCFFEAAGKKFPNPLALDEAVDAAGAELNAETGKEAVAYHAEHCASEGNFGLDILED